MRKLWTSPDKQSRKLSSSAEDKIEELRQQGNEAFAAKQYADAASHYTRALEESPVSSKELYALLLNNRARAHLQLGQIKEVQLSICVGSCCSCTEYTHVAHSQVGCAPSGLCFCSVCVARKHRPAELG